MKSVNHRDTTTLRKRRTRRLTTKDTKDTKENRELMKKRQCSESC